MRGTQPSASPASGAAFFGDAFASYAPGVDSVFSSQSYDCAITIALAAHAAGSNDPAAIQAEMVNVTRGGEKCSTFAACAGIIDAGGDVDYDGASGPIDFLDAGEPSVGAYDITNTTPTASNKSKNNSSSKSVDSLSTPKLRRIQPRS